MSGAARWRAAQAPMGSSQILLLTAALLLMVVTTAWYFGEDR
jgi:hypothetical protein